MNTYAIKYDDYAKTVIDFIETSPSLKEWPDCRKVVLEMLSEEGTWVISLPLISCQAVRGVTDNAVPIAAAWAILHCAAIIFDTVQDNGDVSIIGVNSSATAISLATGLVFSAFHFINSVKDQRVALLISQLYAGIFFRASMGQYMDLSRNCQDVQIDKLLETYWQTVILKSGNIFRAAMVGGAAVGTDSDLLIEALGNFGVCLGVILQVLDDCRDLDAGPDTGFEISLPLILHSMAAKADYVLGKNDLCSEIKTKGDLIDVLTGSSVPENIAVILLEWQQRALESLAPLMRNDAVLALESVVENIL